MPMPSPTSSQSAKLVNSLLNGATVLEMFSTEHRVVSVGEMATHLGTHKSTASRIASTLVSVGYLAPTGDQKGKYRLGWKLVDLGQIALGNDDLLTAAATPLAELAQELGDTAHVGILDGTEAVTVSVVEGWRSIRMHSFVGKRSPVHCSSMGKVLLAGLEPGELDALLPRLSLQKCTPRSITTQAGLRSELSGIRRAGYAQDLEELEEGMCCLAAPVFDSTGAVVASVSVSGPVSRVSAATAEALSRPIAAAAWEVSLALGARREVASWGVPEAVLSPA